MKNIIFTLLLLVNLAHAEDDWLPIEKNDRLTIYAHSASKQKNGNRVKVWFIFDRKQASDKITSQRVLIEFDCKSKMSNILSIAGFPGKMATGEVMHSDDSPKGWRHIAPDSIGEAQFDFACFGK